MLLEPPQHQVDPVGDERLVPLECGGVEPANPRAPPTEMFFRVLDCDEGDRFTLEETTDEVCAWRESGVCVQMRDAETYAGLCVSLMGQEGRESPTRR